MRTVDLVLRMMIVFCLTYECQFVLINANADFFLDFTDDRILGSFSGIDSPSGGYLDFTGVIFQINRPLLHDDFFFGGK